MFFIRRPSMHDVESFLRNSSGLPLSYEPIGLAASNPRGFQVDELVAVVGSGEASFTRAAAALADWKHFELSWANIFPQGASIEPGTVVAVMAQHLGFWSLNGCRILYAVDQKGGTEFGFAYGTLTNHAESGEEMFKVSFRPETGDVLYTIRAVSRPHAVAAKLGYPFARRLQARFRRDSARALAREVK